MKRNFGKIICLLMAMVLVAFLLPQAALQTQAEKVALSDLLEGKTLSVLGDSISTFGGVSNGDGVANSTVEGNRQYYPQYSVTSAADTWWMQAANTLGMDLLVNNAWSGSYLLKDREFANGTTAYGAWKDRCVQLHADQGERAGETPDIIAFFLGTNDFNFDNANVGTYSAVDFDTLITENEGVYTYADPVTTMEAYAVALHKMQQAYPDAEIYCFTILEVYAEMLQPDSFNADIKKMAQHFGCHVVDLQKDCGVTNDLYSFDLLLEKEQQPLHPNLKGMDGITNAFVASILRNSKYIPESAVVHNVSYDLNNVLSIGGTADAVYNGAALELELVGSSADRKIKDVTVTMGGEDITADCYNDGKISIPAVTGDVVITADSVSNYGEHSHDCEHCDDDAQWQAWDGRVEALYGGGHFYLVEDTTMNRDVYTASLANPDIDVTICLNGKTLTGSTTARMFRLSGGAAITIVDCTAKTENGVYTAGKIVPNYHGIRGVVAGIFDSGKSSFTMYDGIIDGRGNNNTAVVDFDHIGGGLIDMNANGEVNLYGGVLKDYNSYYGGAVYIGAGTLTIDGATITNCTATRGRAVHVRDSGKAILESGVLSGGTQNHALVALSNGGTFTMNGGKITDAEGSTGYGVHIIGAKASFVMNGGEISGNASYGVWVDGGNFTLNGGKINNNTHGVLMASGIFLMEGGEIFDNTTATEGAGVRVNGGSFEMNGGKVYDNTSTGSASGTGGIRVMSTFEMTGGEVYGNDAVLTNASQIMAIDANAQITISGTASVSKSAKGMYSVNSFKGATTISGGNFTGGVGTGTAGTLSITGGTFDEDVTKYIAEGYIQLADGTVSTPCTEHDYQDGFCSRCGAEENPIPPYEGSDLLNGITLSVLGDSISTYLDICNGAAATTGNSTIGNNRNFYPSAFLNNPADTWWMQTVNELGLDLLVNNAWSGSYILKNREFADGTTAYGAWQDRCVQLHDDTGDNAGEKPDIIAFYMGTNDFNFDYDRVGSYEAVNFDTLITGSAGNYTYATPATAMEAYAICLHKMQQAYPDAEIYCFTVLPRKGVSLRQPVEWNADVKQMAAHFGCIVVDLYENSGITNDIGSQSASIGDDLHPNADGMDAITAAFVSAILENSKYVSQGTVTHKVSFDFDNVVSKNGTPPTVLSGAPLKVELTGAMEHLGVDAVTVTMGGEDITESCYARGRVYIPAVTGDVTISAKAVWNAEKHTHECEHCDVNDQWIPWNGDVEHLYFGGHFVLTKDTYLSSDFYAENLQNPNIDVTICLNGYTLYGPTDSRMFRISHGAKVSIVDCTAKTENGVYTAGKLVPRYHGVRGVVVGMFNEGESEFTLYDGIVDGGGNNNNSVVNSSAVGGGLIDIATATGKVKLLGGVLKDYNSYYGGAVHCGAGEVIVDGATITDCNATRGRAIMIKGSSAKVTIESGEILGGTQNHGLIALQSSGQLVMNGGKIANAAGNFGYGIHISSSSATVVMNGGEITGNSSYGVWVETGSFQMNDGIISGNLCGILQDAGSVTISGGQITGNTAEADNGIRYTAGTLSITGGMFDTDVSAFVAEGYEQYPNGKVDLPCEHSSYKDGICENCGATEPEETPDYNGLVVVDGVWGYYEGGVLQTEYTGLVPYGDILFYVENGILDFTYTGLVWHLDAWRYVANSQLTEGYTGLVWFNDNWFYTVDSVIDWTFTGLVPYEGNYFYVQNNLLDWSYTSLGYHDGSWYFIQNGLLQKEYSGLVYFNENWFYVEEGVLTYQFFGMVEYQGNMFYVQASHLDWNYTGLGYHEGVWYYFLNALYMPEYDGLAELEGNVFYVENGTVNWDFSGEIVIDGVTYTVEKGLVIR